MNKITLGMLGRTPCNISDAAPNHSVLITGISGSGKTCHLQRIELDAIQNKHHIIVLDTSQSHDADRIYNPIRSDYEAICKRISVSQEGIDLRVFSSESSLPQQPNRIINDVTQMIASSSNLGKRQTKMLRKAVASAYTNYTPGNDALQLIGSNLINLGSDGEDLYDRLWYIFQNDAALSGGSTFEKGNINIIDFSDFDPDTQKIIAELVLKSIWNNKSSLLSGNQECLIILDECQRLYLGPNSMICQILREGRKFGLNVILATQSLSIFSKPTISMLEQAGTKLYFQPSQSDLQRITKSLQQANQANWKQTLTHLRRGECVTDGILQVGKSTIRRPLILT